MHKVQEFLRKLNNPVVYAIAFSIIGIAFIALPPEILDIAIAVIGAIILLFGMLNVAFIGYGEPRIIFVSILRSGALIRASVEMLFGLSLILIRSGVSERICDVLGILISLYSLYKLFRISIRFSRKNARTVLEIIAYMLLFGIGSFILIFPYYPRIMAGIAMLAIGAKLLTNILARSAGAPRDSDKPDTGSGRSSGTDYYTDDFVDKSK